MAEVLCLRAVRPYTDEAAFLAAEAWTITARSILLIDVGPEPEGCTVRVELALASGQSLIVAEGTVVKHLPASGARAAGLVVKFRRMSAHSSEFVRRASAQAASRAQLSSPEAASLPVPQLSSPEIAPDRAPSPPPVPPPTPEASDQALSLVPKEPTRAARSSVAPASVGRRPDPKRASMRPSEAPRAQSVSVIPQARRHSTRPPAYRTNSTVPTASSPSSNSQVPKRGTDADPARTSESRAPSTPHEHRPHPISDSKPERDRDAMLRLRQRNAAKPITVPPDRETILARLKKPSGKR